jgi:rhodanese-related sulfurtransferase
MSRILWQTAIIVLLGVTLGLGANRLSPRGLPLVPPRENASNTEAFIPLDKAKELWQSGVALFLDAREPDDYAAGHIGNALNLPAQSFERHFGEIAPRLAFDLPMVLYCDGKECGLSHRLQASLRQAGYTNTQLLFNGWTAWRQAGLPTTVREQP